MGGNAYDYPIPLGSELRASGKSLAAGGAASVAVVHAERLKEFPEIDMVRYRIDVGTTHGVLPKHIVGAIANEAGLEARYIGRIDLYDDFSTIDLPDGMPKDLLEHLKTVRFGKFRYNLSPLVPQDKPKKSKKK